MKHFHPNPKWPWLGIALFEHARSLIEATGKPYVMENVRACQRFLGSSDYHFGPFHLWGNSLGAMWPWPAHELVRLSKGTKFGLDPWHFGGDGATWRQHGKEIYRLRREQRKKHDMYYKTGSKSKARMEWKAKVAEIPMPLASHIARMAVNL